LASYPSVDESRERLRRAGWSLGEVCLGPRWEVDGRNGENGENGENLFLAHGE
jgi:hypothetical protein